VTGADQVAKLATADANGKANPENCEPQNAAPLAADHIAEGGRHICTCKPQNQITMSNAEG